MTMPDRFAGERLKLSPFYPRQKELNVREAWSSWNGYKFAYSSDTFPNQWWMEHATGADLAVHECFAPPEFPPKARASVCAKKLAISRS